MIELYSLFSEKLSYNENYTLWHDIALVWKVLGENFAEVLLIMAAADMNVQIMIELYSLFSEKLSYNENYTLWHDIALVVKSSGWELWWSFAHYGGRWYEPRGPQAGHPLQGQALSLETFSKYNSFDIFFPF